MWFVGIIFYQLITGQPFFQMDTDELESMEEQGVCVSGSGLPAQNTDKLFHILLIWRFPKMGGSLQIHI